MANYSILPDQTIHSAVSAVGAVDPFGDHDFDFAQDTGADWYRLALSASLGQVKITGVQIAPACESLAKTTFQRAANYQHYEIHYDPHEYARDGAGDAVDLSNPPQTDFVGFRSNASMESAYEPTGLSTSAMRRFTAASKLAGYAIAAGQDEADAVAFAEAAIGGHLPEIARDAIIVPTQFAVRSLVPFGKASHAIYSRGTMQRRVTVDDSSIGAQTIGVGKSMDWGRNVVIARFIGEANVRADPKFAQVAHKIGVPYMLVSGTPADTAPADFFLPPPDMIPSLEEGRGGVPAVDDIVGRITEAVNTQMATIVRELRVAGRENDHQRALQVAARMTQMRRKHVQAVATGTEVLTEATRQRYTAEQAHEKVKSSRTGFDACVGALKKHLIADRALAESVDRYLASYHPTASPDLIETRNRDKSLIMALFHTESYWQLSVQMLLGVSVGEANKRVQKVKRALFGIRDATGIPRKKGVSASPMLGSLLKAAVKGKAPQMTDLAQAYPPSRTYNQNLRAAVYKEAGAAFIKQRDYWAKHYEARARAYGTVEPEGSRVYAIYYGSVARAFKRLEPDGLLRLSDGFIDVRHPDNNWVIDVARKYCEKRNIHYPEELVVEGLDAMTLASVFDSELHPRVLFTDVVSFVNDRLMMMAGDFAVGKEVAEMPAEDLEPVPEKTEPPEAVSEVQVGVVSDPSGFSLDVDLSTLPPEVLALLMHTGPSDDELRQRAVSSYPKPEWAEVFAEANGYDSFHQAFAELRTGAAFDEENPFTKTGLKYMKEIGHNNEGKKDEDEDGDYGVLDF